MSYKSVRILNASDYLAIRPKPKTSSGIDSGVYTQEASEKTYQHLAESAKTVLTAGFSVIIDAAFLKTEQRNLFRQLANNRQVPFIIACLALVGITPSFGEQVFSFLSTECSMLRCCNDRSGY